MGVQRGKAPPDRGTTSRDPDSNRDRESEGVPRERHPLPLSRGRVRDGVLPLSTSNALILRACELLTSTSFSALHLARGASAKAMSCRVRPLGSRNLGRSGLSVSRPVAQSQLNFLTSSEAVAGRTHTASPVLNSQRPINASHTGECREPGWWLPVRLRRMRVSLRNNLEPPLSPVLPCRPSPIHWTGA